MERQISVTYFKLTLFLIFFLRLSLVTNSSVSSLKAKCDGGSLILRLTQSCFITSSTVRVGSILVRTVTPSAVVTMFVGTSAGFAWPALAPGPEGLLGVLAELDMGRLAEWVAKRVSREKG